MFNVSNTPNMLHALKSCEIGNQVPLKNLRNHLRNDYVIRNINENNYSKTILKGHTSTIVTLDVQGYFLATASNDDTIKLWNLDTEKCLWTFNSELPIDDDQNLKIVKENIICSGRGGRKDSLYPYILIIDLNTGQKITSIEDPKLDIRNSRLEPARVCMIGRQIFAILKKENKKYVGEWDINGTLQRTFSGVKCDGFFRTNLLLGSENFLVQIYYNTLKIHDLQSGNDGKIEFEPNKDREGAVDSEIASAYIKDQRLICGRRQDGNRIPNCYVIDLKTEKGTPYTINKFSLLIKHPRGPNYFIDYTVATIILHREWAYLGHLNGHLVAINLEEKKGILLGQHEHVITYLASEEQLLISGSYYPKVNLKFWNIKSLKQVGEIEFPHYSRDMAFVSGKLLVAVGKSLKPWNYFIPHIKKVKKDNEKTYPFKGVGGRLTDQQSIQYPLPMK